MKKITVVFTFLWMSLTFAQSISKLYEKSNTSVVSIKTWQPEYSVRVK